MIEAYLKQVIEDSVRKVVREELQKMSELDISQSEQKSLKVLKAKKMTEASEWEGSYLSREEWEDIAIRYSDIGKEIIKYELGRKAVDIAKEGGTVQNLVDEIERYRNEYDITNSFFTKGTISKFQSVISLYVDKHKVPLETLYDIRIHSLYELHSCVRNERTAKQVIKLLKDKIEVEKIREVMGC